VLVFAALLVMLIVEALDLGNQSMRAFCNLELGRDPIPDETTILNFRHLLEAHELTKTVFEAVAEYLESARRVAARWHDRRCDINRRLAVHQERGGQARSADAFLEEGQSMVLRHEGARGVDAISGLVHTAGVTSGNVARCEADGPFDPR